jgi:competence protein ComEA
MRRPFPANFFALNGVPAMLKKLLMLCVVLALSLSAGFAAAAVEVNSADQATLETVKGIGPVHAKAIIDERTKNGPFKDADDLASRVKGLGTKSVTNLETAGLTINGSATPPTGAKAAAKSGSANTASTNTSAPVAKTPAATTPAAPATTAATTTAAPAAATANAPRRHRVARLRRRKRARTAASDAAAASAPAAAAASAPADASGSKASKKKAKKSKAASAAAASGT